MAATALQLRQDEQIGVLASKGETSSKIPQCILTLLSDEAEDVNVTRKIHF